MPHSTRYHFCRLSRISELAALRDEWNALAAEVPFCTWDWLEAWWRIYAPTLGRAELAVITIRNSAQQLVGVAPWYLRCTFLGGAELRFLGGGEVCSEYVTVLARASESDAVGASLAEWLIGDGGRSQSRADRLAATSDEPPAWTSLALEGLALARAGPRDAAAHALIERLAADGCLNARKPGPRSWTIALPSSWAEYRSVLSRSHRKQVTRLDRRMFGAGRARLVMAANLDDVDQGLAILADLHNRRRSSLGDVGRFCSRRFVEFHRDIATRFLAQGRLRLSWLEVDGRPIAAEYQFRGRETIYAYQSGIEPGALDLEPGRLITMATLRRAIDEGATAYDLLRGDEQYKLHWRAVPVDLFDVVVRKPTWANRGRSVASAVAAALKRWIKTSIRRPVKRREQLGLGDHEPQVGQTSAKPRQSPSPAARDGARVVNIPATPPCEQYR